MSETHETPAERRLREIRESVSAARRGELGTGVILTTEYEHAIDAGREALALLRELYDSPDALNGRSELYPRVRALLARCGEDA